MPQVLPASKPEPRHAVPAARSDPSHPPPGSAPAAPRRFRAGDVAQHLDMAVVGDVCVGVSLRGYREVLGGFLQTDSGSLAALLHSLDRADSAQLPALAHAVKGVAASMGLKQLQSLAAGLEADGAGLDAGQCQAAAAALREQVATVRALLQRMGFL